MTRATTEQKKFTLEFWDKLLEELKAHLAEREKEPEQDVKKRICFNCKQEIK